MKATLDKKIHKKHLLAAVTGFLVAIVGPQGVVAQEGKEQSVRVLDEIIVTAEKRAESLQDIPIAISAFSGDALAAVGAASVKDLQLISPSVQVGNFGSETFITVRGIGVEISNVGAESGVTVMQDGVVLSRMQMMDADFLDIERVEVLRGPQGTINGRNATGGAINIYSKRPTDEFEAGVKATFGNYNRYATEGYLSAPILGSNILGRLAFSTDQADGWLKNSFLNEELNTKDKFHARGSFLAIFSPDVEALLTLDWVKNRSIRNGAVSIGRARADTADLNEFAGVQSPDLDKLTFEADQRHDTDKEQFGATLKLTWDVSSSATLTSITGYLSLDVHEAYDCDSTRLAFCAFPSTSAFPHGVDYDIWQVSQELTLAADLTDRLDLIFGAIYLHDDSQEPLQFSSEEIGFVPGLFTVTDTQVLDSYAAYTQLRYRLTDTLRVSAGVRYTHDEKEYRSDGLSFGFPVALQRDLSWHAYTPRFAIDYVPTEDLTLYASVSRGYKGGGVNGFSNPLDDFDPEFVWNYEAGAKARLFDDRVAVTGAAFFMDYKNLQQTVFGLNGILPVVENAGGAEIRGLELELEALVTDELHLRFAGTWLDTEFTELKSADPIFTELGTFEPGTGLNVRDLSGNRLPRAPEWKFTLGGEYTRPFASNLTGALRVDYTWQSDVFFTFYNHEGVSQGSYGILNLSATVESNDGTWQLSAFGRNLLDKRYFINGVGQGAVFTPVPLATGMLGAPRTYGVSLAYNF